jgi:hypothetical protein
VARAVFRAGLLFACIAENSKFLAGFASGSSDPDATWWRIQMVPGGVTEIIWHFAGYFHFIDETMKDRFIYEDGAIKIRPDDYVLNLRDSTLEPDLEEFETDKIPPPGIETSDTFKPSESLYPGMYPIRNLRDTDTDSDSPGKIPMNLRPAAGGGGDMGHMLQRKITLSYESGGEQQLLEINQTNSNNDDDELLVVADSGVTQLHDIDIDATLQDMIDAAEAQTPDNLALPQGTAAAAEFIAARDTETAESGGDGDNSVAPGRYVNGERQDDVEPPAAPEEPAVSDLSAKGQWAELGGNESTNAALIVDLKEGTNTMIVLGDFFKTNAIVQTNCFIDDDQIDVAGGIPAFVIGDENKADNIAEFEQRPGVFFEISGYFAGLQWNVDVVQGNFYDINLVTQKNLLQDNDVAVLESENVHYEAHLGENEQLNLTQIFDGEIHYDLIVVLGSFHGANLIFQYNVLLDSDILKLLYGGEAGDTTSQSADSGQNVLLNDAAIVNYGDDTFASVDDELDDLLAALASQAGTLDPSFGWLVPGNGSGVLNVLYVTGDYYDINAIWQINVIADVDTAIQYLNGEPPADDGTLTQSASSGGNEASNDAVIVDVGSTSALVGGDVYQDTILVQANLVTDDQDKIVYGDPTQLVSEIVAFTGDDDPEPQTDLTDARAPILQDDTMGSILT